MILYLIRHGETDYNKERRMQGWLDIPLNQLGHTQAKAAAHILVNHKIEVLYSSDLLRAKETAHHISKQLMLKPSYTPALRERDMGLFSGWAWESERDEYKDKLWVEFEAARDGADPDWNKHGGESIADMTARISDFMQELHAMHPDKSVGLVTHGGTINRILEIYNLKTPQAGFRMVKNSEVLVLHQHRSTYSLEEIIS